ncbi:MAG: sodium:alanine symporter family protein [Eggerthellaceae bacterium]|nr:sodium:alanine symporter family protein [Eggerthellaceae bacterium]
MDLILNAAVWVNGYLWNYILIFLLIGMGLFFTIRTGFVQIRFFGEGVRRLFGNFSLRGGKQDSGMTSFQAVATAIAAQVGTGNIVGACGAILIGGPGAIFWMWVIAFFGMATNYAEAVLAQKTRTVAEDGSIKGGPVYYMKYAFKGSFGTFLAVFFSIAAVLALGFFGSMVQSNSIASTMSTAFGIPTWVVGIAIVVLAAFIYIGNVQRLASVVEKLVPFMAIIYIVGGIAVLIANAANIIPAIQLIFYCAFNPEAQVGGVTYGLIAALLQGAKRGLFSNEAGMGSTPHAHAQANVKTPHEQGVVAMVAVFIDTFVVVTMTALVVISVLYVGDGPLALDATGATAGLANTNMAQVAFASLMGEGGGAIFVAICLAFFAFSTILSWNLFAKINFTYLFGKKFLIVFFLIALGFTFAGSILSSAVVWELTDTFNGLMVIPNAIALFALSGSVVACVKTRGADCRSAKEKALDEAAAAELDEPAEA